LAGGCDTLLASPQRLVADDVETTQRYLAKVTEGRARLHATPGRVGMVRFTALEMSLGAVQFQIMTSHCEGQCEQSTVRAPGNRILMHLPLRGRIECSQGGRAVAVEPGQLLVVSSAGMVWKTWRGDRTWLAVAVDRAALQRALAAGFCVDVDDEADFGSLEVVPLARVPALFALIRAIVLDLASSAPLFRQPTLARSMENTLLLTTLKSVSGPHSQALMESAAACVPYYVRRAEKYMREHVREEITIADLAGAAGVSERTVYYGFRHFLGKSPMRYCAQLRLAVARETLLRGRIEGCNITQLAVSLGYATSSHFSRDYRRRYGESPSDTLRG
jgi:AraC-like DNA-binding protein